MQDYKKALLDLIVKVSRQNNGRQIVYLEGGFYDAGVGPGEFAINTLTGCRDIAEEIIKKRYGITRVELGVLVNDIGMVCGDDVCDIRTPENSKISVKNDANSELPMSLEAILKKSKILRNGQQIVFTNEKKLRNRGLRMVKAMVGESKKYPLTMESKDGNEILYNVLIDGDKIPLAIKRNGSWSARCPLIMGQHYLDLYIKFSKKYGNSANQLLVDMCEMYDRHKVNNGAKVAELLLRNMYNYDTSNLKIANFCFQDDELNQYEYDLTEGNA